MIDKHYTPNELAQNLIDCIPVGFTPNLVADFSAGEGSLLNEAVRRWPSVSVFANDLNKQSAEILASANASWFITNYDFLHPTTHNNKNISSLEGGVDLILLNPPFSERGRKPIKWFDENEIRSGLATRFVRLSLKYLSSKGYLFAILPDGALNSERDSRAWTIIKNEFHVEIISSNPLRVFDNAVASTSIVCLRRREQFDLIEYPNKVNEYFCRPSFLLRGRVQMHSITADANGLPLVHTTDLLNGVVKVNEKHGLVKSSVRVKGPGLVFPRVGNITQGKVCILEKDLIVTLSDCVMAIEFKEIKDVHRVRDSLIKDWGAFSSLYTGTGAKYTTMNKVGMYFKSLEGFDSYDVDI